MASVHVFPKSPSLPPSLQPTIRFASPTSFQTSSFLPYRLRRHRLILNSSSPVTATPVAASLKVCILYTSLFRRRLLSAFHIFQFSLFIFSLLVQETLGSVRKTWSDFTSMNYWVVRDYYRLVKSVNDFELQIQSLTDEQVH